MDKSKQRLNQQSARWQTRLAEHQKGSSLLEVLVALLIMAGGLLGLASLQMISLKNINNAQFHSLATAYAYDMAERMRSNKVAVLAGDYDAISATQSDPACSPCTTAQVAQLDGYQWNQQISQNVNTGGLPSGSGTVTKSGKLFNIKIKWKEQLRDSAGGKVDDAEFTLSVQL